MVSWLPPQYPPDSYTVSYSCQLLCGSTSSSGSNNVPNGPATSHTISSLSPGSNCTVSVTAKFGTNTSNTIISSTITTSAGIRKSVEVWQYFYSLLFISNLVSLDAPQGLSSATVESRSLTVVWGTVPCPDQRGPITGYRLRYSNGTFIVNTTGEGSRQHVLTGLTPFTSYSVQVAAVNAGGTGPYSDPALTVETLQDGEWCGLHLVHSQSVCSCTVPAGPVSDLSATPGVVQLTISWSPPLDLNGHVIMYQINYSTGVVFNTSATQHTLRDLPPNTVVVFSVRAYTIIGPGEIVTDQASTTSVRK